MLRTVDVEKDVELRDISEVWEGDRANEDDIVVTEREAEEGAEFLTGAAPLVLWMVVEDVIVASESVEGCNDETASALTISISGFDVTVEVVVAVTVKSTVRVEGEAVVTRVVISSKVEIARETTVVVSSVGDLEEVAPGFDPSTGAAEPPSTFTTL